MSDEKKPGRARLIVGIGGVALVSAWFGWYLLRPVAVPDARPAKQIPSAISPGIESGESDREFFARVHPVAMDRNVRGELVLGPELLSIFDAFRARYLGLGKQLMFDAFGQWAREGYEEDDATYLASIFEKYIGYLELLDQPGFFPDGATMHERYVLMREARERIFGKEVADKLFAALDKGFEIAFRIETIRSDPSLTDEQKRAALEEFKASLDPETREEFFPRNPHLEYREKLEAIAENPDLNPDERAARTRALREDMFGAEAADRLEALDVERAERKGRMDTYWQRAGEVEFDDSLSDDERAARLEELQKELLTEEDVRRMAAREAAERLDKLTPADIAEQVRAEREGEIELDWNAPEQQGANIGVEEPDSQAR